MVERKIHFAPNEYYHLYNRGTDRRIIFDDDHDRNRFTMLLYAANGTNPVNVERHFGSGGTWSQLIELDRGAPIVDIGAYCLMPNHFHMLVREKEEGGITKFMRKFATGYVMYYNNKNKRSGALFEGRFKGQHIADDNYLRYLFAYIHLNPVKIIDPEWKEEGIQDLQRAHDFLAEYQYSSYLDFMGTERAQRHILNRAAFPEYFTQTADFKKLLDDWLTYKSEPDNQTAFPL